MFDINTGVDGVHAWYI